MLDNVRAAIRSFLYDLPDPEHTLVELRALTADNYTITRNATFYTSSDDREAFLSNVENIFASHWKDHENTCLTECGEQCEMTGHNICNRHSSGFNDSIGYSVQGITPGSNVILISKGGRPTIRADDECTGKNDSRIKTLPEIIQFSLTFIRYEDSKDIAEYECLPIIEEIVKHTFGKYIQLDDTPLKLDFLYTRRRSPNPRKNIKKIDVSML